MLLEIATSPDPPLSNLSKFASYNTRLLPGFNKFILGSRKNDKWWINEVLFNGKLMRKVHGYP